ncbi:hypothetical protein Tco_1426102, partial [Tanacetum coccineum]
MVHPHVRKTSNAYLLEVVVEPEPEFTLKLELELRGSSLSVWTGRRKLCILI